MLKLNSQYGRSFLRDTSQEPPRVTSNLDRNSEKAFEQPRNRPFAEENYRKEFDVKTKYEPLPEYSFTGEDRKNRDNTYSYQTQSNFQQQPPP